MMEEILKNYSAGLLSRWGMFIALKKSLQHGKFYPELLPKPILDDELKNIIKKKQKELNGIKLHNDEKRKKVLMGLVMNEVKMSVEGKSIKEKIETMGR
jgi:hypothetical protein